MAPYSLMAANPNAPNRTIIPLVEVVIEIPRGSFIKRGSNGTLDFISPLPCPYNYGSVPGLLGLEGDLLDAVVLGPRLPRGHRVRVAAYGAVGLKDRGLYDDKLICAQTPPTAAERARVVRFFRVYGWAKSLLNLLRRHPGVTAGQGWGPAAAALARARPVRPGQRTEPVIRF
ncbi:MAG TPA: inorganic diphosphatase [Lamprocystis sp. (in: g-proteobacteria)]|nr:inorganic diphosphatase [Lamprocystis sp. (in: g-proteobacteria)]